MESDRKRWTNDRVKEYQELKHLIWTIESLDRGSNFLENVAKCIETAKALERTDFSVPRLSFLDFLRELIVEDRRPEEANP